MTPEPDRTQDETFSPSGVENLVREGAAHARSSARDARRLDPAMLDDLEDAVVARATREVQRRLECDPSIKKPARYAWTCGHTAFQRVLGRVIRKEERVSFFDSPADDRFPPKSGAGSQELRLALDSVLERIAKATGFNIVDKAILTRYAEELRRTEDPAYAEFLTVRALLFAIVSKDPQGKLDIDATRSQVRAVLDD